MSLDCIIKSVSFKPSIFLILKWKTLGSLNSPLITLMSYALPVLVIPPLCAITLNKFVFSFSISTIIGISQVKLQDSFTITFFSGTGISSSSIGYSR